LRRCALCNTPDSETEDLQVAFTFKVVHEAARIMGKAAAGEILVSERSPLLGELTRQITLVQ
jgi:hypothetical protein